MVGAVGVAPEACKNKVKPGVIFHRPKRTKPPGFPRGFDGGRGRV